MYKKRSLLMRMVLIIALLVLIPTLFYTYFFRQTVHQQIERQSKANADFYAQQMSESIQNVLEMTRTISFSCLSNTTIRNAMGAQPSTFMSNARSELVRIIGSTTNFWADYHQQIYRGFYLFRNDGRYVYYSIDGVYASKRRQIENVFDKMRDQSSARTFFVMDDIPNRVYYIMDYVNIDNLDVMGKLIVELDADALIQENSLFQIYQSSSLSIVGNNENLLHAEGDSEELQEVYHIQIRVGLYDVWLNVDIPYASMYSELENINRIYYSLCVITITLLIILSVWLVQSVKRPLANMESVLRSMRESNYDVRVPTSSYREFENIENAFNGMAENLNRSFEDAYQKGIQLQESESRLLAAQINPHFVFNVLESINMRCVEAGQKDIARIVTDLAQLLRGNIGMSSGKLTTIEQELNYVRYYMDLQQSRFGEQLTYSVDYEDEELLQYSLPRLTIQPLVENAVVHGLEPRRGLGHIRIQIWEEENSVAVRVSDNGVGFDTNAANFKWNDRESRHNHIAIPNIIRRLELIYQDRASLQISSKMGEGTDVLLTIPMEKKE